MTLKQIEKILQEKGWRKDGEIYSHPKYDFVIEVKEEYGVVDIKLKDLKLKYSYNPGSFGDYDELIQRFMRNRRIVL